MLRFYYERIIITLCDYNYYRRVRLELLSLRTIKIIIIETNKLSIYHNFTLKRNITKEKQNLLCIPVS